MILYDAPHTLNFTDQEANAVKQTYDKDTKSIIAKINATHGGYINRNYYFYKAPGMRDGTKSWTSPFQKPWIKNHIHTEEPLGRVQAARYYGDKQQGHIQTDVLISDKEAVEKVIDGRYLTVSTGANPVHSVTCSVCGLDLMNSGKYCGHIRGRYYEPEVEDSVDYKPAVRESNQVLCYWIIDGLEYREGSFVNNPADNDGKEYAGVVEWEFSDAEHGVTTIDTQSTFVDPDSPEASDMWVFTDSNLWIPTQKAINTLIQDWTGKTDIPPTVLNDDLWKNIQEERQEKSMPVTADAILPLYVDRGGTLSDQAKILVSQHNGEREQNAPEDDTMDAELLADIQQVLCEVAKLGDSDRTDIDDTTDSKGDTQSTVLLNNQPVQEMNTEDAVHDVFNSEDMVSQGVRALARLQDTIDEAAFVYLKELFTDKSKELEIIQSDAEIEEFITLFDLLETVNVYMRSVQ